MIKIDGRKLRWVDCDWNGKRGEHSCEYCSVCKYLNFIDWAESVGKPEGSIISYNHTIEKYLNEKNLKKRKKILKKLAKDKYNIDL